MNEQDITRKYIPLKYKWHIFYRFGDDEMFTKLSYNSTSYSYKDLGWKSFFKGWINKVKEIRNCVSEFYFSDYINEWADCMDISNYEADFIIMFSDLNFQSKIVILDVMKDYDEQFEILKEDCQEYDQFMYLLDYLRELPLYVMEDMKVIKAQEVEDNFEDYLIGVPISKGKITYNQQENIYKESKELGINPTSFFKEDYIYGIR